MALVTLKDINLKLGDRQLLDSISFVIDEGQRVGLLGANGCGKSTLLNMMAMGTSIQTVPTVGLSVKTMKHAGVSMKVRPAARPVSAPLPQPPAPPVPARAGLGPRRLGAIP